MENSCLPKINLAKITQLVNIAGRGSPMSCVTNALLMLMASDEKED